MKFAFALAFTLSGPPKDGWFGRDKAKHFFAAAAIQSAAYVAFRQRTERTPIALWGATSVTAAASLGKEWNDRRRGSTFSYRDLAWDAGGTGVATIAIIKLRDR